MEIRKFSGIDFENPEAVDAAFAQVESRPIACCNWPDGYPYAPEVRFRMFHTGNRLLLRFDVAENYTAARVTEDNGEVWTDSCVEFFLAVGDESGYYNFGGRRKRVLQFRNNLHRTDAPRIPTYARLCRTRRAGGDGLGKTNHDAALRRALRGA